MRAPAAEHASIAGYRRLLRRRLAIIAILMMGVAAAFLLDLASGASGLAPEEVVRALLAPDEVSRTTLVIVRDLRLPQAVMAVLVGMALALAGAEMQTVLRNPLASPLTLGTSSAAVFGAALAIVLGVGLPFIPASAVISANAFLFAFGSMLLIQGLSRLRGAGGETVVLFGIALFFTFNALVGLLQFIASEQALQQLVFWTLGSLGRASWDKIAYLTLALGVTLPFALAASWRLTALLLGIERAESLGIHVARLRLWALVRVSLLTGVAVAFVGIVGFIGLVARQPAVLLLDEPTSALDLRYQALVMEVLRRLADQGRIVLMVLHDLALAARHADHMVVLDQGRCAAEGPPVEALTAQLLARVYGVRARVETCSRGMVQVMVDGAIAREPGDGA